MSNYLKYETSPYLLQHAENPVDWYPWGEEAFEKARDEDKPIFLSIGYSTCHWCHVMAHESFENEEIAAILNKCFVSVKVDREERPDIDSVYMSVCQMLTGTGGWPMSIFMTWDKKPFFAGTYLPPHSRSGMSGFAELLQAISRRWDIGRERLLDSAEEIISHLRESPALSSEGEGGDLAEHAFQMLARSFDSENGGFTAAPKFPMPHSLLFLLLYGVQNRNRTALEMAEKTLMQMRRGGIFDQIGYGFSRYSTDPYFLAPHFEKMLYDNALLIIAYAAAYQVTKNTVFLDTAEKTAEYVFREMTAPEGGFYSAQDADSEGVEGRFYTFTLQEIMDVLGEEKGGQFARAFDITGEGNFEGVNIPNLLKNDCIPQEFGDEIKKLRIYRENRAKLHLDDKVLTSWIGMMIAALSMLYRITGEEKYLAGAIQSRRFLEQNLTNGDRLCTSYRNGSRSEQGFLDDYAFYIAALIGLYDATLETEYLEKARQFCDGAVERFFDRKAGGFHLSEMQDTELFMNPKEVYDGAIPSGNSVMAYGLVRLYQLTEQEEYRELAERQLSFLSANAKDYPAGYSMFLIAKLLYENPPEHITIVLKEQGDLEKLKGKTPFLANVTVLTENEQYPLLNDRTTYYVCRGHVCKPPSNDY